MDPFLFSTVRVETSGFPGAGVVTAFVVACRHEERRALFLVTCRRSVNGAPRGRLLFTEGDGTRPLMGQTVVLELPEFHRLWHGHPRPEVDIAVTPLGPLLHQLEEAGRKVYHTAIDDEMVPLPDQPNEVNAIEDVLVLGYPNGLRDPGSPLPIVQSGITATPFHCDYAGGPRFLVNVPALPGSAGSPVLSSHRGALQTAAGPAVVTRSYLLGVMAELAVQDEQGRIALMPIPAAPVQGVVSAPRLSMGLATRSPLILEAVRDFFASLK